MGMRKYLIIIIVLSCFLFGSCGERCAKQIVPVQSRCSVKFENNEDGKYSQAMIAQIIKHFHLPNNTVVTIGLDSVFVASEAMLVPLNPDVVVVNGTTDKMNTIYTFIVDKDAGEAILLPSNRGCVGFTSEEGLPICLSFRHHANGESGRYSVVSVYDEKGNLVKEMSFEDYKNDEK